MKLINCTGTGHKPIEYSMSAMNRYHFRVGGRHIAIKACTLAYAFELVSHMYAEYTLEEPVEHYATIHRVPDDVTQASQLLLEEAYDMFLFIQERSTEEAEKLMLDFIEELREADNAKECYALAVGKIIDSYDAR